MREVVSAIILREDRILLQQRGPDKSYPLTWECPGGKVEADETLAQALAREIDEELGVAVGNYELLIAHEFLPPDVTTAFYLIGFLAEIRGNPELRKPSMGLRWCTADDLDVLELSPGNRFLKPHLQQLLRKSR